MANTDINSACGNKRALLIDKLKVITNIILALLLLSVLITTFLYKQDVREAIGLNEPIRLIQIYENKTDTSCLCANLDYGSLSFFPDSGGLPVIKD